MKTIRFAACAALLAAACPAWAQGAHLRRPIAAYGSSSYGAPDRACERKKVADCQSDARLSMDFCGPFVERLSCADRVLTELRACWAATGCF